MKIDQNQVDSIEPFGMMDGRSINLVRLKGGLNLATDGDKVLGAASHQAILCYSIEQRFPSFQPMIMKSEGMKLNAESHSHFLSDDLRKSGHDIYSVQNGTEVSFFITKQDLTIANVAASVKDSSLSVNILNCPKEFVSSLSGAVSEKALSSGLKGVKVE